MQASTVTRFALLRHAETLWNRQKRIQGHLDSPLTDGGRRLSAAWGRALQSLSWDRMLASDLGRAQETAKIINSFLSLPLSLDARLREQDWGKWSGETLQRVQKELLLELPEHQRAGWNFCPPEGETRHRLADRSKAALAAAARTWPGTVILVVTHEGVIKSLIYRLCGRRFVPREPPLIEPGHLHWLVWDGQGLRIEQLNALTCDEPG